VRTALAEGIIRLIEVNLTLVGNPCQVLSQILVLGPVLGTFTGLSFGVRKKRERQ
jgi:hypothetical protein